MQAHELLPTLGFPGGHLPPEGFPPVEVDGVIFHCLPATPGRRKHRIEYLCSACRTWVPYGRAGQHVQGREHKLNHEIMVGRP